MRIDISILFLIYCTLNSNENRKEIFISIFPLRYGIDFKHKPYTELTYIYIYFKSYKNSIEYGQLLPTKATQSTASSMVRFKTILHLDFPTFVAWIAEWNKRCQFNGMFAS